MNKYNISVPKNHAINHELYKQTIYNFPSRGVIAKPKQTLSIDLVDMSKRPHKEYKYILNCVDVSSRKLFSLCLKSKNTQDLKEGLQTIFKMHKPQLIWSDKEGALLSNDMKVYLKDQGVTVYHTMDLIVKVVSLSALIER